MWSVKIFLLLWSNSTNDFTVKTIHFDIILTWYQMSDN